MKKAPDIMLILTVLTFLGAGLTTVVQAGGVEEFNSTGFYPADSHALVDSGEPGSMEYFLKVISANSVFVREDEEAWLVLDLDSYEASYAFNVQLGITYQGETYDLSMGSTKVRTSLDYSPRSDREWLRYAFVGIEVGF